MEGINLSIVNNDNKSDMAIIVIGFDGYSDLWDDYFNLLKMHWQDRRYPVYLSNNIMKPDYEDVSIINCGADAEWSKKVRMALEQTTEPYICLLLEDFFTGAKVDSETIDNVIEFIKKENIRYYKLNSFSRINTKHYKEIDYLYTIPENLEYGVSLLPAIWERTFLLELLGEDNYNAWKFEYARVAESSKASNKNLKGCVFDKRNILQVQHGVVQGKYLPPVIKFFKGKNYELNVSKRPIMTKGEYSVYRLKQIGKELTPIFARSSVKKILNKFGMKFVSDKQS